MIGSTLSHYRITAKLGEGGMGEVYRAHDERLDREVAIKVLPRAVAEDPERLARFAREARTLASLSHQNIATLFGLEEHDGKPFLVMELAEGETLATRLERGPIRIDDVLPIALQLADGLEAAHHHGIIHRDLKPANVMLSPEGRVKILDFGLARSGAAEVAAADLTQSPTLTANRTAPGVLLGTPAYMSPEQARGKSVDRRTDLWAFACVLWEMLTGRRLFTGETASDVRAAVLREEPDWEALPVATPLAVRRLLSRCLAKDPADRLRSAADAALDLREAEVEARVEIRPGRERRGVSAATVVSVAVASLLAGVLGTWWWARSRLPAGERFRPAQFELPLADDQQVDVLNDDVRVAVSPDGGEISWIGASGASVFSRSLDHLEARSLPEIGHSDPWSNGSLRYSPDGTRLALADGNTVWTLPVDGGVPNNVLRHIRVIWQVEWESAQSLLVVPAYSGLYRLRLDDDRLEPVTTLAHDRGEVAHERPRVLPHGRGVLMSVGIGNWHDCHIEAVDLSSGERHAVIEDASVADYVDTGHLVFVRDGTVFAVPFDLERLRATGPAAPIFSGVQMDPVSGRVGQFAVSPSGVVAYVPDYGLGLSRLGWIDRAGRIEPLRLDAGVYLDFRLGPRASDLVVVRNDHHSVQLELYDLERDVRSRLTTRGTFNNAPVWSPDGSRLAYCSNQDGQWNLFVTARRGGGATRLIRSEYLQEPYDWSPDGRLILYAERPAEDRQDLWLVPADGHGEPTPFATTPARELWATFSPDGTLIAYTVEEPSGYEVFLAPVPGSPDGSVVPPLKVSRAGGLQPDWSPSGKELFFLSSDYTSLLSVTVERGPRLSVGGETVVLESIPKAVSWTFANFRVGPDGQRFLVMLPGEERRQSLVVITDWRHDLRRLAGTG